MKRVNVIFSVFVLLGLTYANADDIQYTIQSFDFRVQGLNNSGKVVGMASYGSPPIIWQNGIKEVLDIPGGNNVFHYALNDAGQIVGDSGQRAFSWQDGHLTYIPYIAPPSSAQAVNNCGQVVGHYGTAERAFIWDAENGFVDLGELNIEREKRTLAYAINDNGIVVGQSWNAFRWQNGVMTDLGFPGTPRDINNSGQIVGGSHGSFIWDNGILTYFGGQTGMARAINDIGQVVGYSDSTTEGFPYIWEQGIMRDLNLFLPNNSGWQLVSALDINNSGQILGEGYFNGQWSGFLMTPIPEPTTLLLLGLGGVILRQKGKGKGQK